jgi:iron complex transport system substrate-binding protein
MAATMQREIDAIAAAVAADGASRPRVFYELDATKEIYGPADDSFIAEMVALAGGDPITTGSPTVFSIPLETLVVADPEVIVLGDAAYGVTADQVAQRPGWSAMTAVREGAIRPVDDVVVTRPGPRLAEGLRALALAIDPTVVLPAPMARAGG